MAELMTEVNRFREWASNYPSTPRSGEWECDYPRWDDLYAAVLGFIACRPAKEWSDDDVQAVLYAVARDNEMQHLAGEIRLQHPATLIALAKAGLVAGERDARWQLAEELGHFRHDDAEAMSVLLTMGRDEDEYVRRRALGALTRLGPSEVEQLALEAWHRPDEAQQWARMMALECLERVGSPHLEPLLAEAEQDERQYLSDYAKSLRRGH